jgi:putative membrane protein
MYLPKPKLELAKTLNIVAYIVATVVLLLVIGMRYIKIDTALDFSMLPKVNATVNSIAGVFLLLALYFIKKKDYVNHQRMIFVALFFSTLFLLTYVLYHITTPETSYCYDDNSRYIYFFLLITHIVSAALIFPFILFTFIKGFTFQVAAHKRMARWVFPIWMYVVITGPICYLMLSSCYTH